MEIKESINYKEYDFMPVYPVEHLVFRASIADCDSVDLFRCIGGE